jgi:eukaryotic-like serine/threonine-protein kinase
VGGRSRMASAGNGKGRTQVTPERWQEVKEIFADVLEQKPAERASYLNKVCKDAALRLEVELMIAAHEQGDSSFMKRPVVGSNESLKAGTKLGPYEILAPAGAGGMGEVYRARDTRLNRIVAIKILPQYLAGSSESRDRFEREAQLIAGLNHPHICTLHDVGHQDGTDYLVMEFVEGETLAARLAKGRLPLEQTLQYAIEIVDALYKAHRTGVTHRDLKPGNIMLTKSGAKLLDFGLAKLKQGASVAGDPLSQVPTGKDSITAQGTIVGTLQYMAPEQLQGKETDSRTDIFSFGAVVYEMATGKKAFDGESAASTIAKILETDPPPISSLQPMTPPELDRVVRRCLAKDPDERLQSAHDVKLELEGIRDAAAETRTPGAANSVSEWRRALPWAVGCVAVLAAAALGFVLTRLHQTGAVAAEPVRFEIPVPANVTLSFLGSFAVSPDGRQLAFAARGSDGVLQLWVRPLNSLEAHPLPGSESPANDPFFWSPDSRSIAFGGGGKLKKIDVSGGSAKTLCDTALDILGGSWNREGVIIFGQSDGIAGGKTGLLRVSADGGTPTPVTTLNRSRGDGAHGFPSFLRDGRHFIYYNISPTRENNGIYVGSLDAKPGEQNSRELVATDHFAGYAPSPDPDFGQLLFVRDGALLAQPFDERRLELTGEPVTIAEQVGSLSAYPYFSASTNGVLIYRTGVGSSTEAQLSWYDRQGKPLGKVGEPGLFLQFALSPDETRVGVHSIDPQHPASIILLVDLLRGTTTRFTFGSYSSHSSAWSRDGGRIIYVSNHAGKYGLYEKPVNGEQEEKLLLQSDENMAATSWSPDGRFLLYFRTDPQTKDDLWVLPLEGDKKPIPFLRTEFDEQNGYFSPDGHWVAYDSNETGREEVYVRAFASDSAREASGAGPKWLISTAGGVEPRWRADGRELYYVALDGKLMAVTVTPGPVFQAGAPNTLFQTPVAHKEFGVIGDMDAAADGKRFLFDVPADQTAQPPFTVVQNWQAGLKK